MIWRYYFVFWLPFIFRMFFVFGITWDQFLASSLKHKNIFNVFTDVGTMKTIEFRISYFLPQRWAGSANGGSTPGIPAYPTASSHSSRGNGGGTTRSSSSPASSWGGSVGGLASSGSSTSACSTTPNWEAGLVGSWGVSGGVVWIHRAALGVSPRDRSEQASSDSPKRFRGNPCRREKAGSDGCRPAMYSTTWLRGVSAGKRSRIDSPEGRRIYITGHKEIKQVRFSID